MEIGPKELIKILSAARNEGVVVGSQDAKEMAALRERVLKLELKLNEMFDTLMDLRANQIMGNDNDKKNP